MNVAEIQKVDPAWTAEPSAAYYRGASYLGLGYGTPGGLAKLSDFPRSPWGYTR
jgi:hypothetical protein